MVAFFVADLFAAPLVAAFLVDAFFTIFSVSTCFSNVTFDAGLSSRIPWKEGWRITPSEVISLYDTSQTSLGFRKVAVAIGGLGLNLEGLLMSGNTSKGFFFTIRGSNCFIISLCIFS